MFPRSRWSWLLVVGATAWASALFLAPLALSGPPRGVAWGAALVYEAAGLVCHQRPDRSFRMAGVQQPVCARCAGLYVSGALGALAAAVAPRRRRLSTHVRLLLAAAAFPTALTVSLEVAGLVHPSNAVRAVCALPLGAAAGWLFVRLLNE